jgi:CheY-like chemotaxis protein
MSPEVLRRAFEPFFTTKPDGHGTGLGLSQVYGFVSQSGGVMKLDSEPGVGTAVQIYLPRSTVRAVQNSADTDSVRLKVVASRAATVLLVEDEADIRSVTARLLRDRRHVVIEASDGRRALSALQKRLVSGDSIDILVADIGLPGGTNGRQLADAVRGHLPALPVLLITGYAGQAFGPESEVSEGIELLAKPFSFETLATRIESLALGEPCKAKGP